MKMSRFIRDHTAEILQDWEGFARGLLPAADDMTAAQLRNSALEVLGAIADDMEAHQTRAQQIAKSRGAHPDSDSDMQDAARTHAWDRLSHRFTLDQVVAACRALRSSVTRRWAGQIDEIGREELDELTRFNEAIDESASAAVSWFAARLREQDAQQVRAETALRESEEKFRTVFEAIDEGFQLSEIVVDERGAPVDLRILEVNRSWSRITGVQADAARGRLVFGELIPDLDRSWLNLYAQVALEGMVARFENYASPVNRWLDCYAVPVGDQPDGRFAVVFRDVTERKRAAEEMREREARLRLAASAAKFGAYDANLITGVVYWSPEMRAILGVDADAPTVSAHELPAFVHPDDRARLRERMRQSVDPQRTGEFEDEHRILWPDGSEHWVLLKGSTIFAGEGAQRRAVRLAGVILDITERKQAEAALREADRRKDEFLATLAHELRNPLAPISTGLQIARLKSQSDAGLQRTIDMMDRQLNHLVRLVDDLLDIGRINAGKIQLRSDVVNLAEVLASSAESCQSVIEQHGHTLSIDTSAEVVLVQGDFDRLAQVFSNLLSNAAKYTERNGRIQLRLAREGDEAVVQVADNGIGIPAEDLDEVFELFSQVRVHQGRAQGGLGIGLSLVKSLVSMHQGSVAVESGGMGCGSTFTVRLPSLHREQAKQARVHARTESTKVERRRILIADDNADAANSLAALLAAEGHETRIAYDGEAAVEQAREFQPECAILDLGMPKLDGLQAAQRIRELPGAQRMLLIALTGWGQESIRQQSHDAGFDRHLVKPVDRSALREVLHSLQ